MEYIVQASWFALAFVHAAPSAVVFVPRLTETLYGVSPSSDIGILVVHRGALFLAVLVAAAWAAFDSDVRRMASAILAISMVGFLVVYTRAGLPVGPLRAIAAVDLAGLVPLAIVVAHVWRTRT